MKRTKALVTGMLTLCITINTSMSVFAANSKANLPKKDKSEIVLNENENYKKEPEVLKKVENYVSVQNNRYIVKLPQKLKNQLNKEELKIIYDHAKDLNNIIEKNKVTNVSKTNGFTIYVDDSKLESKNNKINQQMSLSRAYSYSGVTKLKFKWDGVEVWLSKAATRRVAIGGTAALASTVGAIPGLNVAAAAAIASAVSAIAGDYASSQNYPPVVIKCGYNGRIKFTALQISSTRYIIHS